MLVFGDEHGLVTIGTGLVGRREVSVELFAHRGDRGGAGAGRRLIEAGLAAGAGGSTGVGAGGPGQRGVPAGVPARGFVPIGAEVLLHPSCPARILTRNPWSAA